RRGLVVSPSAFEEPPDAAVRARGQQSHFRQLNFDGAGANEERRDSAAHQAQAEELCQTRAHNRGGNYRRLSGGRPVLWEPGGDGSESAIVDKANFLPCQASW